jgi:hypothetical protein
MRSPLRRRTAPHLLPVLLLALSLAPALAGNAAGQAVPARQATAVPAPDAFFGFRMGDDGRLATWDQISRYFAEVAAASDRVELLKVGPTTEGHEMIAAIVSAPENIARLDAIQAANRRLADPRTISPDEARALAATHPAVVAIGASIHASEIGATQAASEMLHWLATAEDEATRAILSETVVLLIPSLNPDGHRLVVDWFESNRGTPFEAAPMPWLYQKYAGHDINRDAFMLNLAENRTLANFFYGEWHPHVFLSMHQMGPRGPRFFVPPNYDPIDPNHDPLIWRTAGLLGSAMSLALEQEGKAGVVSNAMYDYYWPGYEDSAPLGHNTVCLLTEVASARLALPVEVAKTELTGSPRGLPVHRPSINFPNPWPGGTWRLRDIVDYELTAVRGLLDAVRKYREGLVRGFEQMGRRAIENGRAGGPFAFVIPEQQFDPLAAAKLIDVLVGGHVEVQRAVEPFSAGGRDYAAGTYLVLMAQPFRAYAKTLLERQEYPVRKLAPDGPLERPYDVAGWTLPLQMGVAAETIDAPFDLPAMERVAAAVAAPARVWGERRPAYYVIEGRGTSGALAANRLLAAKLGPAWLLEPLEAQGYRYEAGALVVRHSNESRAVVERLAQQLGLRAIGLKGRMPAPLRPFAVPRIALYKPWLENIDEGWTRWLLERFEFPFRNVDDAEVRAGGLRARYDVIVLPDAPAERLIAGHRPGSVPPAYAGGLGKEGVNALGAFVAAGGTLACLDSSCQLAIESMGLPVKDVVQGAKPETFFCPGSVLGLDLDTSQPLALGMPPSTSAFFAYGSAYEVSAPEAQAAVVARYAAKDLLQSGWIEGAEAIAGRPAVVEVRHGEGRVVLFGFRVQHRAQSYATFRLLFNAVFSSAQ